MFYPVDGSPPITLAEFLAANPNPSELDNFLIQWIRLMEAYQVSGALCVCVCRVGGGGGGCPPPPPRPPLPSKHWHGRRVAAYLGHPCHFRMLKWLKLLRRWLLPWLHVLDSGRDGVRCARCCHVPPKVLHWCVPVHVTCVSSGWVVA